MDVAPIPRWRKLALVFVMFLITGSFGFIQPFQPLWFTVSGISRSQIGFITGLATATALIVQPILGKISDRIDARRPLMLVAALIACAAYLAYGYVQNLWAFLGLAILASNGFAYLNAVGGVLVGRLAAAGQGGAGYARYRVWGSVGYVVIAMGSGLLIRPDPHMTRADLAPIFTYGPWIFFVIALMALLVPDPKRPPAPPKSVDSDTPKKPPNLANLDRFLLAFGLYTFALYGATGFLAIYMRQLGATPRQVTWMFAAGVVCEVLVMSQVGRWTDQHGRKPALALGFILMPLRLLLYIPALGPAWVIAVQSLHGLNFGIVGAVGVALVNDVADDTNRGSLQARLGATAGLSSALGQLVCGWLSQSYSIAVMFAVMSAVGFVAAFLLLTRVKETLPQR
ncbi:MAG: MFS transporter [Armatimonas sp.]